MTPARVIVRRAPERSGMPYTTELMSFAVKPGKEARAEEWMKLLIERQAECNQTLDREAMHFETIFKCQMGERMVLSWFSVQGDKGAHVSSSPFPIDQLHMQFWQECIDPNVPPLKFEHVVNFLPPAVQAAIDVRDAALSSKG
jgi:Family of unknown function (DUF6176)